MCITRFVAFTATLLAFTALPSFSQTQSTTPTPAAKPKPATNATTAKPATAPTYDRALLKPALLKDKAPDTFQVKFETTRGDFTLTVTRSWSPLGADRFYNLVKHHYYDDAPIFRVAANFVAQFGISAYPPVTAAWHTARIKDDPRNQSNKKGTIVFADSGPDTRTTQVFINLANNDFLDSKGFTPFGVVDGKGLNVVEMFYDQYGEAAGVQDQPAIEKGGKKYVEQRWPKLDSIKHATLVGAAATAPAAKPAATTKSATTPKPAANPQP